MKVRVGVFFGGKSVEHEVSIISAMQAIAALDREKYEVVPVYITKDNRFFTGQGLATIDAFRDIPTVLQSATQVLFLGGNGTAQLLKHPRKMFGDSIVATIDIALPVVHGTNVEDGALQGFFEYLGVPYTGCSVGSSAAGMDKWAMKALFLADGIPVARALRLTGGDYYANQHKAVLKAEKTVKYPMIIKPSNLGSSVGIGKAKNRVELEAAIEEAFAYAPVILCEQAIENLREINVSVLGDRDAVRASVCEEPLNATDFLTYKDKYQSGGKSSKGAGMESLSRKIPADINKKLSAKAQKLAMQAFRAIDAAGVARVDLLMNGETQEMYVNEINTIPGSLSFYLWEATGTTFSTLLDEMVAIALKRNREMAKLSFSFETNLLAGVALGSKGKLG